MNKETIQILDTQNWGTIILELTSYVIKQLLRNNNFLSGGLEAEDLVLEAIEKVYSGERRWNPESDPDITRYLKSVLKSLYSNETSSLRHKSTSELSEEFIHIPGTDLIEDNLQAKALDSQIMASIRDKPGLCLLYKALKDGYKPAAIAEEYGWDITQIRNTQKRLLRHVLKILVKPVKVR